MSMIERLILWSGHGMVDGELFVRGKSAQDKSINQDVELRAAWRHFCAHFDDQDIIFQCRKSSQQNNLKLILKKH